MKARGLIWAIVPLFAVCCVSTGTRGDDDGGATDTDLDTDTDVDTDSDTDSDTDTDTDTDSDTDTGPGPFVLGCSDATREGFVTLGEYPLIAACNGAWSIAGIFDMPVSCERQAGNDGHGQHREGGQSEVHITL